MFVTRRLGCVLLAFASCAGAWPKPAAGPSASGDPEVVLTFDDGPHERYTPIILDELARRGLRGTFFWVGHRITGSRPNMDRRVAVARRAIREGHLVGNHTINHAKLCRGERTEAAHEIDENRALYERLLQMPVHLFRVPYGARCNRVEQLLAERHLTHMHWDIDPREWRDHDLELTAEYLVRKLRNLDGRAVILLHDTKRISAEVLPRILDWIDTENLRRTARGKRPIRIVSYMQLERERLQPGVESWLGQVADELATTHAGLERLTPVALQRTSAHEQPGAAATDIATVADTASAAPL